MARQRLPELHPAAVAFRLTTGLTNGSRRPTVLAALTGVLSVAALVSCTATVVFASALPFTATAIGWLPTFAGTFAAAADLKGSDFTGTAAIFGELPAIAGLAVPTVACPAGGATTAGLGTAVTVLAAAGLVRAAG